jgi:NTE family protein
MKKTKSALVMSGGGALGAFHIGAYKVLFEKYDFEFFAGVSAGAIVSGLMAIGKSADEMADILNNTRLFSLAFDPSRKGFALIKGVKIKKLLDKMYEGFCFEDLEKPLYIGVTDFKTGERVIINKGKIADAVRASISVPYIFEPYYYQGRYLVDGGLTQNFPLDIVMEKYKGDSIIGIDLAGSFPVDIDFSKLEYGRLKGLRRVMERSFRIMFRAQQSHFPEDERVRILRPDLRKYNTFDIFRLEDIRQKGENDAMEFLANL